MKHLKMMSVLLIFALVFASCKKSNDTTQKLNTNIVGLENLGTAFKYEGWLIVGGKAISTGTFTVSNAGVMSQTSFDVDKNQLASATDFVLTIEPFPDADPAPTATHILAGSFISNMATISVNDSKALGTNFSASTGKYILATPTNGMNNNEKSGIWFLSLASGAPTAGLSLPVLPAGWVYEGWVVVGGVPLTTGRFTNVAAADLSAPFSETIAPGPPFPGEDYLKNAPAGFTFPLDLSGGKAVISVEPNPDNSPMPFTLKPLIADIPVAAMDHVTYSMSLNTGSLPSGTITR